MGNINVQRMLLGVIIASVFYFIADGVIHGAILAPEHEAAVRNAGKPVQHDPMSMVYFAFFDLGKGFIAMLFYVLARARFGAGVRTAIYAGLATWLAIEVLPGLESMPFPFYEKTTYWKWMALELVPVTVGAILGAWPYKE